MTDMTLSTAMTPATPTPRSAGTDRRKRFARGVLLPGQIISLLVLVVPLLIALGMSFTAWSPTRGSIFAAAFIGL